MKRKIGCVVRMVFRALSAVSFFLFVVVGQSDPVQAAIPVNDYTSFRGRENFTPLMSDIVDVADFDRARLQAQIDDALGGFLPRTMGRGGERGAAPTLGGSATTPLQAQNDDALGGFRSSMKKVESWGRFARAAQPGATSVPVVSQKKIHDSSLPELHQFRGASGSRAYGLVRGGGQVAIGGVRFVPLIVGAMSAAERDRLLLGMHTDDLLGGFRTASGGNGNHVLSAGLFPPGLVRNFLPKMGGDDRTAQGGSRAVPPQGAAKPSLPLISSGQRTQVYGLITGGEGGTTPLPGASGTPTSPPTSGTGTVVATTLPTIGSPGSPSNQQGVSSGATIGAGQAGGSLPSSPSLPASPTLPTRHSPEQTRPPAAPPNEGTSVQSPESVRREGRGGRNRSEGGNPPPREEKFLLTVEPRSEPLFNVSGFAPGDVVEGKVTLGNAGTIRFNYSLMVTGGGGPLWTDREHGLQLEVKQSSNGAVLYRGPLAVSTDALGMLQPGRKVDLYIKVWLPIEADNTKQNQQVGFDLVWTATEAR